MDENGYIKLADFGLAKPINDVASSFCGTLEYLAPEVVKEQIYTKEIDYWTFGCLLFEMIAGRPPFNH